MRISDWSSDVCSSDLLDTLSAAPAPVVLSGDVHSSWVSDLRRDFADDESPLVGTEFVAPGISSDIPARLRQAAPLIEALSPHIAWSEVTKRGWVRSEERRCGKGCVSTYKHRWS